ncbi:MAG: site-specific DNA-methyltransferase, partial [Planctomycetota bacterium]|nr:site-specific DNA-methyltransferase [Planctomycetota bacterium]
RQVHPFEKPAALMRHLLLKHTRPGELVFEACGCAGVMSSVAIEHGRRWVYAESNIENYRLGASRIANHLAS